jgi:hypothetical protein
MNTAESFQLFSLWAAREGYDLRETSTDEPNPFQDRDTRHAWEGWEQSRMNFQIVRPPLPPVILDVRRLGETLANKGQCTRGKECACTIGDLPREMCSNWWVPL